MRPAITVTNLNREKKVSPGWFVSVGKTGRRFSEELFKAEGVAWINEQLEKA